MPVQAATPLTIDDPAGDALDGRGSMDILKLGFDVRQVNKSGPPSLVFELTLADPPETQLASYNIDTKAGDCRLDASWRPGTLLVEAGLFPAGQFSVACGDEIGTLIGAKMGSKDNVISMSLAMDSVPKPMRQAGALEGIYAFTQTAEPVFGVIGNGYSDGIGNTPTPTDSVSTDKKFKFV